MSGSNPFGNLKIDVWYKVLIPLGGVLVVLSIIYTNQTITQKELFVLGFGLILIGMGEWKREKFLTRFVSQSAFNPFMRITQPFKSNDPLGIFFQIIGIIAVFIFVLNFFDIISILI